MATQATALAPASQSALTKALSMKGEIVAYHQAATRAAEEAMENLFQCGRLLESVRDVLKAEKTTSFGKWVEQFCGFSERSAQGYCKLHNDLRDLTKAQRAALFNRHQSQRAVTLFLSESQKSEEKEPVMPEPKPVKHSVYASPDDQYPNEPAPYTDSPEEPVDNVEPVTRTKEFDIPFTVEELASTKPERHAPEPWRVSEHPDGTGQRLVVDANGEIVLTESEWVSPEEDAANHARIVECVNAMAGIQDPKAFVARHEHADYALWLSRVEPCEPVEASDEHQCPFPNWQNGTQDQQDVAQKVAKAIDPSQFTPPVEQGDTEELASTQPEALYDTWIPQPDIIHFKTTEMLRALSLSVDHDGGLWSLKNGRICQRLSWTAEEALAYAVGQMLEPEVRREILTHATTTGYDPNAPALDMTHRNREYGGEG